MVPNQKLWGSPEAVWVALQPKLPRSRQIYQVTACRTCILSYDLAGFMVRLLGKVSRRGSWNGLNWTKLWSTAGPVCTGSGNMTHKALYHWSLQHSPNSHNINNTNIWNTLKFSFYKHGTAEVAQPPVCQFWPNRHTQTSTKTPSRHYSLCPGSGDLTGGIRDHCRHVNGVVKLKSELWHTTTTKC